ncbi:MAG: hypothetical protein R2799_11250 [Crocinitomicaceae bacterium]
MKRSILLILTILSLNIAFNQNSKVVYDSDSRWFLSFGGGVAWHTTDVKTKIKFGFTGEIGYSFFMKPASPISLDLGFRYLTGVYEGQNYDFHNGLGQNIALNGEMDTSVNYAAGPGRVPLNFRSTVHDISLELQLNTNRLRERTGINLFLFGSIGFSFYRTLGNLTQFDVPSQSYVMYDYETLYANSNQEFTKSNIKGLLDDTYESALEGSSLTKGKINSKLTPSIGAGFSYQIAPRIAIGLEHRTTFTLNDLFDGNRFNQDNSVSTNKDLYHYTGAFIRFHLKSGKAKVTPEGNNSLNQINNYNSNPIKPEVDIFDPADNPYTTDFPSFTIKAVVLNVSDRSQVTFKQNGAVNNNFTFDPSTHRFESNVSLNPGQNVFEVRGTNSAGTDAENRIIVLESEEKQPPIVNFNNPSYSPYTTTNGTFQMSATVLNVEDPNKVTVELNGQSLTNFTFNPTTDVLTCPLNLNGGPNTVRVTGTNDVGTDSKETVIVYEVVEQAQPPIVNFVVPGLNPYTTQSSSMNVQASVLNVDDQNNIGVKINGQSTANFNWNPTTHTVDLGVNLNEGNNVIEVSGTNAVGYDSKSTVIIKKTETELPPVVSFIDPNINPKTVFAAPYNLVVRVENVQSNNQIELKINGLPTTNFNYVASSKLMTFHTTLIGGANIFEVTATNNAGQDSKNTTIILKEENLTQPPIVTFTNPGINPITVNSSLFNVAGTVLNVDNSSQIQVLVNGNTFSSFTFNAITKVISFPTSLMMGNNVIQITATNNAGTDSKQTIINYEQIVQGNPPIVTITSPFVNPYSVNVNHHLVTATVLNVDSKSQIQVRRNGMVISQYLYSFDINSKQLVFNATLSQGNNIFEISAANSFGSDMKTTMIVYNPVVAPCNKPIISFQKPGSNPQTVSTASYEIRAQLLNVASSQNITLRVNGNIVSSFSFNTATKILTKNLNLNPGTNVIQIEATNTCGGSSITTFLNYDQPNNPCIPPVISPISPNISNYSSLSKYVTVQASVTQVLNSSNLSLKLNGQNVNFTFDNATKMLIGNLTLNTGNNSVVVSANNGCGVANYTWNIYHSPCSQPSIVMNNPTVTTTTVSNPSFVVSAVISEIQNSNNIQFRKNGQNINFIYNSITNSFNSTVNLSNGVNNFELVAQNQCGNDTKQFSVTYNPIQTINPPEVDITNPNVSPYNTSNSGMTIKAIIDNVASASQITVIFNGMTVSNFNYSPTSGILTFYTGLQNGNNTVKITAVNQAGSDMDQATIIYNPPVTIDPPQVVFTSPTSSPKLVAGKDYTVKGFVRNVTSSSQVIFKVNGQTITNYQRNFTTGRMEFSLELKLSNANNLFNVNVTGTNQAGTHSDYRIVQYDLGSNPMGVPGSNGGGSNMNINKSNGSNSKFNPNNSNGSNKSGGSNDVNNGGNNKSSTPVKNVNTKPVNGGSNKNQNNTNIKTTNIKM